MVGLMNLPREPDKRHLLCTIVTPNYLNQFLILGESIATSMPSVDLRVLVLQDCDNVELFQESIDEYLATAHSDASHRAVTIDQCDWGDFDIESAVLFYGILEFATSVKPALLRSFLHQGWERVTYLDPDIQVFEDFSPMLDDHLDVALTPHILTDIPRDNFRPSTNDILQAGFYNLGFCSVRPTAVPFLDWWSERLQFDCLIDHAAGYFTDQKIVDLAPLKAHVQVIKEPGFNVAYWNLHERTVTKDKNGWIVKFEDSTHPLYFFHFSGFALDRTSSLSTHATRKVLGEAVPRSFATQYAKMLLGSGTPREPLEFTLGGVSLQNPLPKQWKQCLREDAEVHVRAGLTLRQIREEIYFPRNPTKWSKCRTCAAVHDNFGTRVASLLVGWTCHPSLDGVPNAISAFFRTLHYESRSPTQEQMAWALEHLRREVVSVDDLVNEILNVAGRAILNAVNLRLIGYFTYPAGVGRVARWTLQTLEEAGIHPAIDRVFVGTDSLEYLSTLLRRDNPLAVANASVLCFITANEWQDHVKLPRRTDPRREHVEAVWAWELEEISSQMLNLASSNEFERLHALSNWSADAMSQVVTVPVQRFAPFDLSLIDTLAEKTPRTDSLVSTPHYILTTFDAKSLLSRKNPEGVVRLWERIQTDYPDHSLVIKSTDLRNLAPAELLELIDLSPRTILVDEHLSDGVYFSLLSHCDVFVSLHRSEGMGLTPIEAGLCGIPVVYTNYGGVSEYMGDGFFPVSFKLTQVGESIHETGPYDKLAWWAEPDLDDAESQIRRALEIVDNGVSASLLTVDREQLRENLISAQSEVVATARRLIELTPPMNDSPHIELANELIALSVEPENGPDQPDEPKAPDLNPVMFALVSVVFRTYKAMPARLRFQFNLAIEKLRGR